MVAERVEANDDINIVDALESHLDDYPAMSVQRFRIIRAVSSYKECSQRYLAGDTSVTSHGIRARKWCEAILWAIQGGDAIPSFNDMNFWTDGSGEIFASLKAIDATGDSNHFLAFRTKGETVLNIDRDGKLKLTGDDFAGQRVAILGISGSGKTTTAAVTVEEIALLMSMTILDIEGEYWGLNEKFDFLIVGRSEHAMIDVPAFNADKLAKFVYEQGLSVILDMSGHDEDEQFEFVLNYFEALWECAEKGRKPHGVLLEECHEWIPQRGNTPVKKLFKRYAKRGRKHGITLILSSQRSAEVDKGVLTQCGLVFLHRVTHPTDKGVYYRFIPWKPAEVNEKLSELRTGQAIVIHDQQPVVVQIRERETFHAGFTPSLTETADNDGSPKLRKMDEAVLSDLRNLVTMRGSVQSISQPKPDQSDTGREIARRIAELEQQNAMLTQERDKLKLQLTASHELIEQERKQGSATLSTVTNERNRLDTAMRQIEAILASVLEKHPDTKDDLEPAREKAAASRIKAESETAKQGDVYRSPQAIKQAEGKQRNSWQRICQRVRGHGNVNVQALAFLVGNEGVWFNLNDMGRMTGFSPASFKLRPFVDMGLLEQRKLGRKSPMEYRSVVRNLLSVGFADLPEEELISELTGA